MIKVLKKLKSGYKNNKKIFAFDVETKQKECVNDNNLRYKKQDFLMGCVVGENVRLTFWDKKLMSDYLLSNFTRDSMIFATNLDFDFNILFGGDKRFKESLFVDKNGLIHVKKQEGKHYWSFYDTLAYTKASVSKLGKMIGEDKLKSPDFSRTPKSYEEREYLKKYCMQDAKISYLFARYFQDYCNKLGMKMKVTIASTGLDYWRRNYQPVDLFQERREWLDLHYEGSFKGGRTEVFKRGYIEEVHGYDFKSMYPSVCCDGIDGKGGYPNPNSVRRYKNAPIDYIKEFEGISKVRIYCPYMYIPLLCIHDHEGKLYFPIGDFEGWFTHVELREAINSGYVIKDIYDTVYYTDHFIPFKEVVTKLYSLRQKYKKDNNPIMTQLLKDQMNSGIFGKFAQKINNKIEMFTQDDLYAEDDGEVYVIKEGKKHILNDYIERGNYVYNNIGMPDKVPLFIFPILSSYTTALSRIKLWRNLIKYPDDIVYTDTDSLYLKRKLFGDSQDLGKLEYLGEYHNALFVKPKQYYLEGDGGESLRSYIKCKGVPNRYINTKKDFYDLIDGKSVIMERFTKVKESAVRKIPYGSIIQMEKSLSNEDTKRMWLKRFSYAELQDSRPIVLS